jgi:UDP-3-O-[3-hydroxymyristoyl] glucosamine N-acyltransferase
MISKLTILTELMPASPVTTGQIAALLNGTLIGPPDVLVHGASGLRDAKPSDVSFIHGDAALKDAFSSRAAVLLTPHHVPNLTCPQIVVAHPALAMTTVVQQFFAMKLGDVGLSNLAYIGKNVTLGAGVSIWPFVTLDEGVSIGQGSRLYPGVFVGAGSVIGENCVLYPNVTVREAVTIGNGVIIHPGTVIGSDGFGFLQHDGRHHKIPQIGTVVIEDDVELGANVTVDRATYGATIVGRGTKVDNLVQIAHNVKIGDDNIIVAQVGIAGSSTTGHHVVIGGQAGIADHVTVGDQVMIAARCGISRNINSREVVAGFPAMPHKTWLKTMGVVAKLPELRQQLRDMEHRLSVLEKSRAANPPGDQHKRGASPRTPRTAPRRKR